MSVYAIQAIFILGLLAGIAVGLGLAVMGLLIYLEGTSASDEAPAAAVEDAHLHGYGIVVRDADGSIRALSPSEWAIRRKPGWRE